MKKWLTNPISASLLACLCCLLWGSAFPVIKISYTLLSIAADDSKSQILFAGIRFALAGLLTIIFGSIISKKVLKIKKSGIYKIPCLSLFQTILQYLFFYIGLANTTATKSSILDSVSVFFSVIIASIILRQEHLNFKKIIGCILGFAGVVIINLSNGTLDGGFKLNGEGFILLSALSYSVSTVMIKRFSVDDNPVALSGYQFTLGGIIMMIIGFALGGKIYFNSFVSVLLLLYLSLLSAAAYTLWGLLLKFNDVSKISVYGFMIPVFGCLLSVIILKESIADNALPTIISLVLVSAGIYIVNMKSKSRTL